MRVPFLLGEPFYLLDGMLLDSWIIQQSQLDLKQQQNLPQNKTTTEKYLAFLVTRPILKLSRVLTLNHLIILNSGMIKRSYLWKTKDSPMTHEIPILGAPHRKWGQRPKIFLLIAQIFIPISIFIKGNSLFNTQIFFSSYVPWLNGISVAFLERETKSF